MHASKGNVPVVGYAVIVLCMMGYLFWQGRRNDALVSEMIRVAEQEDPAAMYQRRSAVSDKADEIRQLRAEAGRHFKLAYLLIVVLPGAVVFPALLAPYEAPPPVKPTVVSIHSLNADTLDLGIPEEQVALSACTRLIAVNLAVCGAATALLALFPLLQPGVFGGLSAWMVMATGLLMIFASSYAAHWMKENGKTPPSISATLAGPNLLVALVLVWIG